MREGTRMEERAGFAEVTVAGAPGVEWDEDTQSLMGHRGEHWTLLRGSRLTRF